MEETHGEIPPESKKHASTDMMFQKHPSYFKNETIPAPFTLVNCWDMQFQESISTGMGTEAIKKASDLLKFRAAVGSFPSPFTLTAEQLATEQKVKGEYAKKGITVSRIDEDASFDPIREAFKQAWAPHLDEDFENQNVPLNATQAYQEVKDGRFYDRDTQNIFDVAL